MKRTAGKSITGPTLSIFTAMLLCLFWSWATARADWGDALKEEMIARNPLETPVLTCVVQGLDATVSWTDIPGAGGYTLDFVASPTVPENNFTLDFRVGQTSTTIRLAQGDAFHVSVAAYDDLGRHSRLSNTEWLSIPQYGKADITGTAYVYEPVSGAAVCVTTGDRVHSGGPCVETDAGGLWQGIHAGLLAPPVRVEVYGGHEGGRLFDGTLSAYLPYHDLVRADHLDLSPDRSVAVNVLTTIIDRYMRKSGVDYETAVEKVFDFFSLPADIDVFSRETWEPYFSAAEFTIRCMAEEEGDFDLYTDSLVARIGSSEKEIMKPDNGVDFGTAFGKEVVKVGFGSWAGEMAIGVVGGALVKTGLNLLLPVLGFDTTETHLKDIRNRLGSIQKDVVQISSKIDSLSKQLIGTEDRLSLENKKDRLTDSIREIDQKYKKMMAFAGRQTSDKSKLQSNIEAFANSVSGSDSIENAVYGVYFDIMPNSFSTGYFQKLYEILIKEMTQAPYGDRGSQLLRCYNALQMRFNQLVAYQLQAGLVMINANSISYKDNPAQDDTEPFLGELQAHLNDEVAVFLTMVENLVVASADVRTLMYGDYRMFPREVEQVFFHADFTAQQFSTEHDAGFVIRILGEKPLADRCYGAPSAGALKGALKRDPKTLYPALIPAHYPGVPGQQYYLGWRPQQDNNHQAGWQFKRREDIAMYKLTYADPYAGRRPAQVPKTRKITYGDFQATGRFGYFDEDANLTHKAAKGSTLYGHAVVTARYTPRLGTVHVQSKNQHGEWTTVFFRNSAVATGQLGMRYTLNSKYRDRTLSDAALVKFPPLPYADSEMSISTVLKNGDNRDHNLELALEMTDTVDSDWRYSMHNREYLKLSYAWRLSLGGTDLVKVSKNNVKTWTSYWWDKNRQERNYTKAISLAKGKGADLLFASDHNVVDIWERLKPYRRDDTGSTVVFSHKIKKLELVPQP